MSTAVPEGRDRGDAATGQSTGAPLPGEQVPRDQGPGEPVSRNQAPRYQGPRDQGPLDQGPPTAGRPTVNGPGGPTGTGYDRRAVVARQKEQFGGLKFGATFFGWLTAAGAGVLLTAILGSIGAGTGLSAQLNPGQAAGNAGTYGLVGLIVLLVVILLAYLCGGYVAGRMARFNGVKQGVGVWLWGIIAAVVIAVLAAITGNQVDASRYLDGAPQIPLSAQALTTAGIVSALAVIAVALVGAILGGLAGMRFHRRVDRAADDI